MSRIVTAAYDKTARIWSADSGELLKTLEGHSRGFFQSANFSPDGTRIVTTSKDSTAKIWSADSGQLLQTLKGHANDVSSAAFSPDGTRIVTASGHLDYTAKIWRTPGISIPKHRAT